MGKHGYRNFMITFLIFTILIVAIHVSALAIANKIKQNPAPRAFVDLLAEPEGEKHYIRREDGTELFAITAGTGPTVVMAHGFGMTHSEWNLVWDKLLAAGFRVIAFDQRGHGRSAFGTSGLGSKQMASDYNDILNYFDVQNGTLLTHSMGGFLAIVFLLTYPSVAKKRLSHIVLGASLAGNVLKGAPQNFFQIPMLKWGIMQKMATLEPYRWLLGLTVTGTNPSPAVIEATNLAFTRMATDLAPALQND